MCSKSHNSDRCRISYMKVFHFLGSSKYPNPRHSASFYCWAWETGSASPSDDGQKAKISKPNAAERNLLSSVLWTAYAHIVKRHIQPIHLASIPMSVPFLAFVFARFRSDSSRKKFHRKYNNISHFVARRISMSHFTVVCAIFSYYIRMVWFVRVRVSSGSR